MKDKGWVLVTDGNRRSRRRATLIALRSVVAGGYKAATTVSGPSLAATSRYSDRRVVVPPNDEPGYAAAIRREMAQHDYVTVLPTTDRAVLVLERPGHNLLDKGSLGDYATAAALETPPSWLFPSLEAVSDAAHELPFPLVIKPNVRRHFPVIVRDLDELSQVKIQDGSLVAQPFIDAPLSEVSGVMWNGRMVVASHHRYLRVWPHPCGTVCAAETTEVDQSLEVKLERLLAGYEGIFQAQFAGGYLLDLNPYVHTSVALGLASGINVPAAYCDLVSGREVATARGKPGAFFRWVEGDLRSLVHSAIAGHIGWSSALRQMLPRRGTAHLTPALHDPGPLLARLWLAVQR
jgi:hypothetical protein